MNKNIFVVFYNNKAVQYREITPGDRLTREIPEDHKYILLTEFVYTSKRYGELVTCPEGMTSDGATGAFDIRSLGWWVHDALCNRGKWDSGRKVTNFQASLTLKDILKAEGRIIRDFWWFFSTFLCGGGEARKNGMFSLKA